MADRAAREEEMRRTVRGRDAFFLIIVNYTNIANKLSNMMGS